ncbi:MAG: cysteine--tRNA ligase [Burkholderiales bacterium]|jgi:cysteinyl-tRNA synthetase|nr:cysteine--tRNA ligase [Burkholderiales bacterium]
MLRIYNTLARDKQPFVPLEPGKVRMYVCGMTVYDYCHLGHARVMVVFDLVTRWLRASGYQVTYVRNITDIDDKIIRRAAENGESMGALTQRFIDAMDADAAALGVVKPDHEPRATEYVPQMQEIIGRLERGRLAYVASDGDVNYSVRDFPGYGKLSGKSLEDLRAGERVEVNSGKRDPLDFVLWKRSKEGEPFWESAWGRGRPGWHIECSAMSAALLGETFDIHGGGQDLQFPHHENEIAQSEGANGKPFVRYWMHNGFVRVDDEKMSKSLGNFFTVREVLARYDAEVVRFFIARAHYRSPLNYSDKHLDDARQALARLYTALKGIDAPAAAIDRDDPRAARFGAAMDDDFNTPEAIAVLFELAGDLNRTRDPATAGLLRALGHQLGLLERDPIAFLQAASGGASDGGLDAAAIEARIAERTAAKKARDFARADAIRAELLAGGIVLEDGAAGTLWRRA